jgi:hyperosmotically inducible protein
MRNVSTLVLAGVLALGTATVAATTACKTTSSPGTQVDDATIKVSVKAKLAKDVRASTWTNIEVNSTNGVVTLAGQVESEADRREAEAIARSVSGVVSVNNALQVKGR